MESQAFVVEKGKPVSFATASRLFDDLKHGCYKKEAL